jgi:hypothetical protein
LILFPFTTLNPNAGKQLQKGILLFPLHTSSTHGDAHVDDYMPLLVVPNVTNVHQPASKVFDTSKFLIKEEKRFQIVCAYQYEGR